MAGRARPLNDTQEIGCESPCERSRISGISRCSILQRCSTVLVLGLDHITLRATAMPIPDHIGSVDRMHSSPLEYQECQCLFVVRGRQSDAYRCLDRVAFAARSLERAAWWTGLVAMV